MGHLSGFFHGQRYLNVHQGTFSSLGLGRLRPLSSGDGAPGWSSTADGILVARGLFGRTTRLRCHVWRSIGFYLSHDGFRRHDDADLFFRVLSQRVCIWMIVLWHTSAGETTEQVKWRRGQESTMEGGTQTEVGCSAHSIAAEFQTCSTNFGHDTNS